MSEAGAMGIPGGESAESIDEATLAAGEEGHRTESKTLLVRSLFSALRLPPFCHSHRTPPAPQTNSREA